MTTKIVVNCETGVTEEIPLTSEELEQAEKDRANYAAQLAEQEAAAAAKEAKRLSAAAKLRALGLDEDEVAALVG